MNDKLLRLKLCGIGAQLDGDFTAKGVCAVAHFKMRHIAFQRGDETPTL